MLTAINNVEIRCILKFFCLLTAKVCCWQPLQFSISRVNLKMRAKVQSEENLDFFRILNDRLHF